MSIKFFAEIDYIFSFTNLGFFRYFFPKDLFDFFCFYHGGGKITRPFFLQGFPKKPITNIWQTFNASWVLINTKVLKNIKNIVQKCRSYGIENIFISGLLQTTRITADVIGKVNELIKDVSKVERCFYVSNDDISHANLFKDGLHLLDNDKQILADNFVFNVNRNFLTPRTFHPNVHLTAA